MARERLQKILAQAGVSSRRHAEALITAGRVRVNGHVVDELGVKADARKDRIEVDGTRIVLERFVYVLLHKPRGVVTTLHDPEGRPTIAGLLRGLDVRVYPVGRLDFHTSGAILVTNDGALTEALLHPTRRVPKTYVTKVRGKVAEATLAKLAQGVTLDDGHHTAPAHVFVIREEANNTWLEITIHEGKNRQIHRMMEAVGYTVMRLARTSFAGIAHEGLKPGEWRELEEKELLDLRKRIGATRGAASARASGEASEASGERRPRARPGASPRGEKREGRPRVFEGAQRTQRAASRDGKARGLVPAREERSRARPTEGDDRRRAPSRGGAPGQKRAKPPTRGELVDRRRRGGR